MFDHKTLQWYKGSPPPIYYFETQHSDEFSFLLFELSLSATEISKRVFVSFSILDIFELRVSLRDGVTTVWVPLPRLPMCDITVGRHGNTLMATNGCTSLALCPITNTVVLA